MYFVSTELSCPDPWKGRSDILFPQYNWGSGQAAGRGYIKHCTMCNNWPAFKPSIPVTEAGGSLWQREASACSIQWVQASQGSICIEFLLLKKREKERMREREKEKKKTSNNWLARNLQKLIWFYYGFIFQMKMNSRWTDDLNKGNYKALAKT